MEDLVVCRDRDIEAYDFQFKDRRVTTSALQPTGTPPASKHFNLLACSSLHGYLFAATAAAIDVFTLSNMHEPDEETTPSTRVDLAAIDVSTIRHILLLRAEAVLVVLATRASDPSESFIICLHVTALIDSRIHSLPAPSVSGVVAIAGPSLSADQLQPATSVLLVCITDVEVITFRIDDSSVQLVNKIELPGALSVAFSPLQNLLAVGTPRGSVALYNPTDGTLLLTIVEVESGWQPFQLHFAGPEWLLTSYEQEGNLNHIMRRLQHNSNSVVVRGISSLGNLYLPSVDKIDATLPVITFVYIEEWHLGIMASSMSEDAEVFQLDEGKWMIWRMSEDSSPEMACHNNNVTFALGLAIDFNDMSNTLPDDVDDPLIKPMPTLIFLNTAWFLLTYRMVDFKKGASCKAIRPPTSPPPLPPLLPPKPPAVTTKSPPIPPSTYDSPTTQNMSTPAFRPTSPPLAPNANADRVRETSAHAPPQMVTIPASHDSTTAQPNTSQRLKPAIAVLSDKSFTGTQPFLSNFNFTTQSDPSHLTGPQKLEGSYGNSQRDTSTNFSNATDRPVPFNSSHWKNPSKMETAPEHSSLPTLRLQPQLDGAMAAMSEARPDDPRTAVRSIIMEMEADLAVTRQAASATWEEVNLLKGNISSTTEKTTIDLTSSLQELLKRYDAEKELRESATQMMKQILKLHRDYETIRMEDNVSRENGPSQHLRAEYKAADEQMKRREAEIEKSIRLIEDKLSSAELEQKQRRDPAETVQMIYSSLSLQGLRIRRILNHLTTLTDRVEKDDQGGRRSDLGLSLARLEKLSLGSQVKQDDVDKSDSDITGTSKSPGFPDKVHSDTTNSQDISDGSEIVPSDVRHVLRRLAMRGGRECITVQSPPRRRPPAQDAGVKIPKDNVLAPSFSQEGYYDTEHDASFSQLPPTPPVLQYGNRPLSSVSSGVHQLHPIAPSKKGPLDARVPRPPSRAYGSLQRQASLKVPTVPPTASTETSSLPDPRLNMTRASFGTNQVVPPAANSQRSSFSDGSSVPTIDITPEQSNRSTWTTVQTSVGRPPMVPPRKAALSTPKQAEAVVQYASLPPDDEDGPISNIASKWAATNIEFASMPPDDNDIAEPKNSSKAIGTSVQFAAMSPDDDDTKAPKSSSKSAGSTIQFASMPLDDYDEVKAKAMPPRKSLRGPSSPSDFNTPVSKSSPKVSAEFACLPPDDDEDRDNDDDQGEDTDEDDALPQQGGHALPTSNSGNVEYEKVEKPSNLFAALPPDDDYFEEKQSGLFTSLPPEKDAINDITSKGKAVDAKAAFASPFGSGATPSFGTQAQGSKPVASAFPLGSTTDNAQSSAVVATNVAGGGLFGSGSGLGTSSGAATDGQSSGLDFFGSSLNLGGGSGPPVFGIAGAGQSSNASGSQSGPGPSLFGVSSGAIAGGSSPFASTFGGDGGTGASFGTMQSGNASMFGAAVLEMSKTGDNMVGSGQDGQAAFNGGTSTDDSDSESGLFDREQGMGSGMSSGGGAASGFGAMANNATSQPAQVHPFGGGNNGGGNGSFGNAVSNNVASSFGAGGGDMGSGMAGFGAGGQLPFGAGGGGQNPPGFAVPSGIGDAGNASFGSASGFGAAASGGFGTVASGGFGAAAGGGFGAAASGGFGDAAGGGFGNGGSGGFGDAAGGGFGGGAPAFGVASSFGAASPLGGSRQGFGMSAGFGQSGFANTPSKVPFGGDGSGGEPSAGQSPFGGVAGASPFGATSGGSGFASLAGSGGLSFGNGQPPSFTSAAFSERRS